LTVHKWIFEKQQSDLASPIQVFETAAPAYQELCPTGSVLHVYQLNKCTLGDCSIPLYNLLERRHIPNRKTFITSDNLTDVKGIRQHSFIAHSRGLHEILSTLTPKAQMTPNRQGSKH